VGPRHHGMVRPQVAEGGTASNILKKQSRRPTRGGPLA